MRTEKDECIALVEWMDIKRLKFSHIPNETYTPSWNQKMTNKRMGVRKGFPDYCIIIPQSKTVLFLEMKRAAKTLKCGRKSTSGITISPEQKEWIHSFRELGGNVHAQVAFGFDEAIRIISKYMI